MMWWRNQLQDTAVLHSLLEDLQLFWQFKALEWEKLERRVVQVLEEAARSDLRPKENPEEKLRQLLENNADYVQLRDRIEIAQHEALLIAQFLGYRKTTALQTLHFSKPLPDNAALEAAIDETEKLSRYCHVTHYLWHMPIAAWYLLKNWIYEKRQTHSSRYE